MSQKKKKEASTASRLQVKFISDPGMAEFKPQLQAGDCSDGTGPVMHAMSQGPSTSPGGYLNYEEHMLDFVKAGLKKDRRLRLGRGSFGEVYEATFKDKRVAVKEFDYEFLKVPAHQKVFVHEVRILHGLQHANIVEMMGASTDYAAEEYGAPPFIVFEFLPTTLFAAIHVDHVIKPKESSVRIACEIASALDYLHSQTPHIVHHDLKPENVMLTDTLQSKLIDFGLSSTAATRVATSRARPGHGQGTIGYMPPEKLAQPDEVSLSSRTSHKVDVYAFGVVLLEILSQQLPYLGFTDEKQIIEFVKSGDAMRVTDGINPPLLELIRSTPADRGKQLTAPKCPTY